MHLENCWSRPWLFAELSQFLQEIIMDFFLNVSGLIFLSEDSLLQTTMAGLLIINSQNVCGLYVRKDLSGFFYVILIRKQVNTTSVRSINLWLLRPYLYPLGHGAHLIVGRCTLLDSRVLGNLIILYTIVFYFNIKMT